MRDDGQDKYVLASTYLKDGLRKHHDFDHPRKFECFSVRLNFYLI
jgi:hypothetical protein